MTGIVMITSCNALLYEDPLKFLKSTLLWNGWILVAAADFTTVTEIWEYMQRAVVAFSLLQNQKNLLRNRSKTNYACNKSEHWCWLHYIFAMGNKWFWDYY